MPFEMSDGSSVSFEACEAPTLFGTFDDSSGTQELRQFETIISTDSTQSCSVRLEIEGLCGEGLYGFYQNAVTANVETTGCADVPEDLQGSFAIEVGSVKLSQASFTEVSPGDPETPLLVSLEGEVLLAASPNDSTSTEPPFVVTGSFKVEQEVSNLPAQATSCRGPRMTFDNYSVGASFVCGVGTSGEETCFGTDTDIVGRDFSSVELVSISSAGGAWACSLDGNSALSCWGHNTQITSSTPTGTYLGMVSSGYNAAVGLSPTGALSCWGNGCQNTLPTATFSVIDQGFQTGCGLTTANAIECWGHLGNSKPTGTFTSLGIGHSHGCAVASDSSLVCWATNESGVDDVLTTMPSGSFTEVSSGLDASCAFDTAGALHCWGKLGDGANMGSYYPAYTSVDVGHNVICAEDMLGGLQCWMASGEWPYAP